MCSKSYKSWFGTVSVSTVDNTSEVSWIIELTGDRRKIKLRDVNDICNSHNFIVVLAGFKLYMFNIYSPMLSFTCPLNSSSISSFDYDNYDRNDVCEEETNDGNGYRIAATDEVCYLVSSEQDGNSFVKIMFFDSELCVGMKSSTVALEVPYNVRIVKVVAGSSFVLFLTDSGQVFSSGTGLHGELGTGTLDQRRELCLISGLEGRKIVSIGCGLFHAIAIEINEDEVVLHSWGWNHKDQLLKCNYEEYYPIEISTRKPLKDVYAFNNYTKCIYSDDTVELIGSTTLGRPV